MACYECALDYVKGRTQFDKPIAQFQLVQEKLAAIDAAAQKPRAATMPTNRAGLDCAWLSFADEPNAISIPSGVHGTVRDALSSQRLASLLTAILFT